MLYLCLLVGPRRSLELRQHLMHFYNCEKYLPFAASLAPAPHMFGEISVSSSITR